MLCYCIAILLAIVGGVLSSNKPYYNLAEAEEHFENFIEKYHKQYESDEEYYRRFEIFKKKLSMINHWNRIHEATFDVNNFADEEEPATGHVRSGNEIINKSHVEEEWIEDAPSSLDYRTMGLVTEVKNQGPCRSCYIFAAVANIESQYAQLTGELISLSEQQALDCVGNPCDVAGDASEVMRLLSEQDGLMSEADYYPYVAKQGQCQTDKNKVEVKVTSRDVYEIPNEEALKGALAKLGPLTIGLHVSPSIFHYSKGAVLKPQDCHGEPHNHAVLLVGYSTDDNGTPYWIIKNSWGSNWGDDGYLHLEMGKQHCSILQEGAFNAHVARPE